VFALQASDGATLWTFNATCTGGAADWIVGMPYVDYGRNRLYVTSRAGSDGTQTSLWVIDTLSGALVTPPSPLTLGHLEGSPNLSADGNTIWVNSWDGSSGTLYAVNANTLAVKWNLSLGAAGNIKGFVWEDYSTPGRLYFSNGSDVRCVQDNGASGSTCGGWTVSTVAGASTLLLLDKIYVGSSDGKLHRINPSTGVEDTTFPAAGTLDGTQVGDVSTETSGEVFVGTAAGKLYKIPLPLP
jgi:outer membrane protein assembly factor BamB